MADKVKIYEIAKQVNISSSELVQICKRAGFDQITHHSNAVSPQEAEEIRKAAIRLYKPKETLLAKKKAAPKKTPAEAAEAPAPEAEKRKELPSTEHVKPVAPPRPKGRHFRTVTTEDLANQRRASDARRTHQPRPATPPPQPASSTSAPPKGERRRRSGASRRTERTRETEEPSTRRTVVFKRLHKPPT